MPLFIVLQSKEINSPQIEMSMKYAGRPRTQLRMGFILFRKLLHKEPVSPIGVDEFLWSECPCNLSACAEVKLPFGKTK